MLQKFGLGINKFRRVFNISHGYKLITLRQVKELAIKYDNVWRDKTLPIKQYEIVKKQIQIIKRNNTFGIPYSPAIKILKRIPIKDLSLLDIGCSSGYYGEIFKLAGLKIKYEGCDYSEVFIRLARSLYPKIRFKVADATKLPYKNKSFSVVLSSGCIQYIRDYNQAIIEAARIAKHYIILHRLPVCYIQKTSYFTKRGYDLEMMELAFNETELLDIFSGLNFGVCMSISLDPFQVDKFHELIYQKSYLLKRFK